MDGITAGIVGVVAILVLIGLRVPIGLVLTTVGICGLIAVSGWSIAMTLIDLVPYEFAASWELSAIPMFLLMGTIAYNSGLTASLFEVARRWLSGMPGGLAVASNFASAGFAAASGSSLATTVAMGQIAIPEMLKSRYDRGLAAGVIASSGTLGSLIPPSVLMILYGVFAEQSISQLFIAGILPGILTACVYALMIVVRCTLTPSLAPREPVAYTLAQRLEPLKDVWPLPVLILAVIGSIYFGISTPTEAGAFGAVVAAIIAALRGRLTWVILRNSVVEALQSTASIFFVGIGAVLLTRFMVLSGLPLYIADLMDAAGLDAILIVLMTAGVYLVLGMFLDPIGLMLLTLPIVLPIFEVAQLEPIWIGILIVKFVEIGLMTPPVGLNVYAVKTIVGDRIPLETIFRGVLWFLFCEAIVVGLLIAFPDIILVLPRQM